MKRKKDERKDRRSVVAQAPRRVLVCPFCQTDTAPTYKSWEEFQRFVSDRGRILARSRTGICARHQRKLAQSVKRARHLALLPFSVRPS